MRTYVMSDLVQLPRFSAAGAIALGAALESSFKECSKHHKLSKSVTHSCHRLGHALDELRKDFSGRVRESGTPTDELRAADADVDSAWSSLEGLLSSFIRLPLTAKDAAKQEAARKVHSMLFPDGLKFTQLPFKYEWSESQARLDIVLEQAFEKDIAAISGGELVLSTLRRVHKAYGDLQGLSSAMAEAVPSDIRTKLDAFSETLRDYVVRVVAMSEPDDEAGQRVVGVLLRPLTTWQSSAGGSTSSADSATTDGTAPSPATPAAPANPAAPPPVATAPAGTTQANGSGGAHV
jgi:hypothetical protein